MAGYFPVTTAAAASIAPGEDQSRPQYTHGNKENQTNLIDNRHLSSIWDSDKLRLWRWYGHFLHGRPCARSALAARFLRGESFRMSALIAEARTSRRAAFPCSEMSLEVVHSRADGNDTDG